MRWEVILPRNKIKVEITDCYFYQTLSMYLLKLRSIAFLLIVVLSLYFSPGNLIGKEDFN